jgi:hypothetical protein
MREIELSMVFRVQGSKDADAFEAALDSVMERLAVKEGQDDNLFDSDMEANAAQHLVALHISARGTTLAEAETLAADAIRRAIHESGALTPDWSDPAVEKNIHDNLNAPTYQLEKQELVPAGR